MSDSPDAIETAWLTEAGRTGALVEKISQALLLLESKRVTLEEKMIALHLQKLAFHLSSVSARIFESLAGDKPACKQAVATLRQVNLNIDEAIGEFLKIARYDLNYLEQYFEHQFVKRLTQDFQFLEQLSTVAGLLQEGK